MILKEEHWPADAHWILADFLMSDEGAQRGNVTPRCILARNDKIILTTVGNRGWEQEMWPKILEITGTSA